MLPIDIIGLAKILCARSIIILNYPRFRYLLIRKLHMFSMGLQFHFAYDIIKDSVIGFAYVCAKCYICIVKPINKTNTI